jgi:spermidine synthase
LLILYIVTVFVSALLMFMIQPLFANTVLPLLGGSPAVWNTATMFYQSTLLLGYIYAHVVKTYLKPRAQAILHGVIALTPLLVLPIGVPQGWTPPTEGTPVLWMLALLAVSVGLPFFVLSTTSSLIQAWFARSSVTGGRDPYFLYAASNVGSMLGLLVYPLVMQPVMRLHDQKNLWSAGYVLLALLLLGAIAAMWRTTPAAAHNVTGAVSNDPAPSLLRRLRWILLAFVPSSLMSSVTTYITTDVTPVPLLWVLPLALYLLTFILVFAKPALFTHNAITLTMQVLLLALAMLLTAGLNAPVLPVIVLHILAFFAITLVCHAQLAASRPAPSRLTEFYLFMSLGGALGGVFTALIAPALFTNIVEYPLVLLLPLLLLVRRDQANPKALPRDLAWAALAGGVTAAGLFVTPRFFAGSESYLPVLMTTGVAGGLAILLPQRRLQAAVVFGAVFIVAQLLAAPWSPVRTIGTLVSNYDVLDERRSFFGVKRVLYDRERDSNVLLHGSTLHGGQLRAPGMTCMQTAYYSQGGPVGQFLGALPRSLDNGHLGVVGLGSGVLAGYGAGKPAQRWTYFEIDPDIKAVAQDDDRMFSFLNACTPGSNVVLGDARLTLAREAEASFDVLFMDAYSSDAIPVHLITKEALQMYQTRIKPDGYLMFHITNRYFDLRPILGNLAAELNMTGMINSYEPDIDAAAVSDTSSVWVVLAKDPKHLAHLAGNENWRALKPDPSQPVWTDDFSSLLSALRVEALK